MDDPQPVKGEFEHRPEGFKTIDQGDLEIDRGCFFEIFSAHWNLSDSLFKNHSLSYYLGVEHEIVGVAQKGNFF